MFDPCDQRASLNKSDTLSICQLSSIMSERGSPRASYTASFKLRVLAFATDKGNRAAGKQFNVDESCVRRWRSQREKLFETPPQQALLHFRSSRKKSLSGSPRSAKPVQAYPLTLFALKRNQSPKSWDWNNSERPNAGATASWIDLASPSEGEQALSHVSGVHRSPALFWFKFRFFFSTVSFSKEDNHCQLYATLDFVKFIVSICEQTNDLSFTDKSAFWTSYSFFSKSCLKVGGAAYTRVRLIHESLR